MGSRPKLCGMGRNEPSARPPLQLCVIRKCDIVTDIVRQGLNISLLEMLWEIELPKSVENTTRLSCRVEMITKRLRQMLLKACCIAVDISDEHVTHEALPTDRSSQKTTFGLSGLVSLRCERGETGLMECREFVQLLPKVIPDCFWRDFSHTTLRLFWRCWKVRVTGQFPQMSKRSARRGCRPCRQTAQQPFCPTRDAKALL